MSWQQVDALEAQALQMRQDLLAAAPCASIASRQLMFANLSGALACAVSLYETELKSPMSLALWSSCMVFTVDGFRAFTVDVYMMGCADACFAMEPARALRLKGHAVVFGSFAQYASTVGLLYSLTSGDFVDSNLWLSAFYASDP